MRIQWKPLLLCFALPLAVGGLAALLTQKGMASLDILRQPPLFPPDRLFPVIWTLLYLLMGLASYQVRAASASKPEIRRAWLFYILQLAVNFLWPILFFNYRLYLISFLWLVLLWALIFLTMRRFDKISTLSGWLLLPYLLWVSFAGYLNLGVYLLN